MDTDVIGLQLIFVPPETWMLDETLSPAGVRIKIENGVVFFKPAGAIITPDVIELDFHLKTWRSTISMDHPVTERLITKLTRLGLSKTSKYFELHPAQRGWDGISLRSSASPPDRAHLRVRVLYEKPPLEEIIAARGHVTAMEVKRLLALTE